MKAVVCEVCGSMRFVKQDGLYICEHCGMKYTVEAMSGLIGEVPDGTVGAAPSTPAAAAAAEAVAASAVVASVELEELYQSAREARSSGDTQNAAKHYEAIFAKDPSSWEAAFYGSYFRAKDCKPWQIRSASNAVRNAVSTSLKLIRTQIQDRNEQIAAAEDVALHATEIANQLFDTGRSRFDSSTPQQRAANKLTMVNDCSAAKDVLYCLGNDIDTLFAGYTELQTVTANAWKNGVEKHNSLMDWYDYKESNRDIIMEYVPKIQKYDNGYQAPEIKIKRRGCYVATAVYGSYDCPEVWTLRRYRDNVLAETRHGRAFIRFYYAVSPRLVAWFGNAAWFRRLWKPRLDRFVARLNAEGFADTPYDDQW